MGSILEDGIVNMPPGSSHFVAAAELIDAGAAIVAKECSGARYVVFLASDTWLYKPEKLAEIIDDMRSKESWLAAAPFGVSAGAHGLRRQQGEPSLLPGTGLTTDFFVVDLPWAWDFGMLPLDLSGFVNAYGPLLDYFQEIILLEKLMEGRYLSGVRNYLRQSGWRKDGLGSEGLRHGRRKLRTIDERRIDPEGISAPPHKGHWPELGLITIEDPFLKRAELSKVGGLVAGVTLERFLSSSELDWFNSA